MGIEQLDQGASSAEDRAATPAEPSTAVSGMAGIPCAALPGDVVQITNVEHPWFPCLIVVSELKSFGIQGFAFMPANDGSGTGEAYIRLQASDYEPLGAAAIIMSESTLEARNAAAETVSA